MNLQEFVHTSLVQIVTGVAEARTACAAHDGIIGPDKVYGQVGEAKIITDANGRVISPVEFDIALAEGNSTDTKGGIGVFLGAVGVGSQGASHGDKSTHSRIKFTVHVIFPGVIRK